ncbi:MAG: carboxymuconolactone decarboxylase family protein [Actinobacteria bacterium ATB1]|nr:carboxymuconolactone decarboxylase family protein [Actinobacteria bacterium ATB1]
MAHRTRPATPRVAPLEVDDLDPEIREILGDGPILNIFRVVAVHPKLLKRWLVFGNHVLAKSTLPARDREIAILRIGWLCGSEYEWAQHVRIGLSVGLTGEEIERIPEGASAEGWSDFERAILRAVDELDTQACLTDESWEALSTEYDTRQMLDLVFAVGQYRLVSMVLNTLGVPLDEGLDGFPEGSRGDPA